MRGMRGRLVDNDEYCSKQDSLTELGARPQQGSRADLEDVVNRIASGDDSADNICVTDPGFYHMYGRTLQKAEDVMNRKKFRNFMTKGIWYYGDTGVGKSHKAFEGFDPETHYVKPVQDEWWDGYTGQEVVILNDIRGQIPYSELLNLVDKWPHSVKRRCREPTPFMAKVVIVTSSLHPLNVYTKIGVNDSLAQIHKRFEIIHLEMNQKCSQGNTGTCESKKRKCNGI